MGAGASSLGCCNCGYPCGGCSLSYGPINYSIVTTGCVTSLTGTMNYNGSGIWISTFKAIGGSCTLYYQVIWSCNNLILKFASSTGIALGGSYQFDSTCSTKSYTCGPFSYTWNNSSCPGGTIYSSQFYTVSGVLTQ